MERKFFILIKIIILRVRADVKVLTSKFLIQPIGRQDIENRAELFTTRMSVINKLITCLKYPLFPR